MVIEAILAEHQRSVTAKIRHPSRRMAVSLAVALLQIELYYPLVAATFFAVAAVGLNSLFCLDYSEEEKTVSVLVILQEEVITFRRADQKRHHSLESCVMLRMTVSTSCNSNQSFS